MACASAQMRTRDRAPITGRQGTAPIDGVVADLPPASRALGSSGTTHAIRPCFVPEPFKVERQFATARGLYWSWSSHYRLENRVGRASQQASEMRSVA